MHDQLVPDRRPVLAVAWCAAAALGALFIFGVFQLRISTGSASGNHAYRVAGYTLTATVIAALLVLRLVPGRGWPWLLALGSILSLPAPLAILAPRMFDHWPKDLFTVIIAAGPGLVLLGVLGAAAWVWTAGARGPAVALAGAALAIPYLGTLTVLLLLGSRSDGFVRVLLTAIGALALLGGLSALPLTARSAMPVEAPSWRLTGCAALAAVLPLVQVWFPGNSKATELLIGLVVLAITLLLSVLADPLIAPGALLASLLNVALFTGATLSAIGFIARVSELAIPVALAGIGFGWLASRSAGRIAVGLVSLGICATATFLLPDSFGRTEATSVAVAAVLLVIWPVASMASSATIATTLRAPAQLPAAFGVFAPAAAVAVTHLMSYFYRTPRGSGRNSDATLIAVMILIAMLGIVALAAWHRRQSSTVNSSEPSV